MNLDAAPRRARAPRGPTGCTIAAWSVYVAEARRASVGTKDRETGDPHAPLTLAESLTARYKLIWDDGRVSRGAMERRAIEREPEAVLAARARGGVRAIRTRSTCSGPRRFPRSPSHDAGRAAIAAGRRRGVRAAARRHPRARRPSRHPHLERLDARRGRTARVVTSAGLDVAGTGTSRRMERDAGRRARRGVRRARRRAESPSVESRLDRLVDFVARACALRRPRVQRASSPSSFTPTSSRTTSWACSSTTCDGAQVAHGTGAFRREQFTVRGARASRRPHAAHRPVASRWRRERTGSARKGSPRVRARSCRLGRLRTPLLDLKYARRLGLTPTANPAAMDTIFFEGANVDRLRRRARVRRGRSDGPFGSRRAHAGFHERRFLALRPADARRSARRGSRRLRATISETSSSSAARPTLRSFASPASTPRGCSLRCRLDPA